jgi:hypothetical protein
LVDQSSKTEGNTDTGKPLGGFESNLQGTQECSAIHYTYQSILSTHKIVLHLMVHSIFFFKKKRLNHLPEWKVSSIFAEKQRQKSLWM